MFRCWMPVAIELLLFSFFQRINGMMYNTTPTVPQTEQLTRFITFFSLWSTLDNRSLVERNASLRWRNLSCSVFHIDSHLSSYLYARWWHILAIGELRREPLQGVSYLWHGDESYYIICPWPVRMTHWRTCKIDQNLFILFICILINFALYNIRLKI